MKDKCIVSSLSEYIAAIEKYNLFNCISRGENQKYKHPLNSSAQRRQLRKYHEILDEYHLQVETTINQNQNNNFLAFAQHHGIPTNLLDFSFSPLVSLYFSIDNCKDKGYVYFINKSKMVNINKAIYKKPFGWGMLNELLNCDVELCEAIWPQMATTFINNRNEMITYFEKHAEELIEYFRKHRAKSLLESIEGGVDDFEKALLQYKDDKPKWEADEDIHDEVTLQIYSSVPNFLSSMQKIYKGDLKYPKQFFNNYSKVSSSRLTRVKYGANIDVMLFLLKMEEIEYCYNDFNFQKLVYELEFPYYFTYNPPVIDDRVRNQSSVFIFQPFSTGNCYKGDNPIQIWQKIVPDFVIEIQNPEGIKKELDAIGFNSKYIYSDFDSIAKYIVDSI